MQRENADLRRACSVARKEAVLLRIVQLPKTAGNLVFYSQEGDADVLRAAANEGLKKCDGVFVCLSGENGAFKYVIAARGNLRTKAREINAALGGRGGGSDTMIQGSFSSSETEICDYFKEFTI